MKALVAVEVGVEILLEKMIIKGSTCASYNFLQEAEEVAEEPLGAM